jgi:hypothetical protein
MMGGNGGIFLLMEEGKPFFSAGGAFLLPGEALIVLNQKRTSLSEVLFVIG